MSTENEAVADADEVCASCGKAEFDDVKLKICECKLVKYCRDECQINHREQHEEECKKGLAEIRDRDLFEQPRATHFGECPICCLPLPLDPKKCGFSECCSKLICHGCNYANQNREFAEGLKRRCAFCREPKLKSQEEAAKKIMKRIKENNDPAAMCFMGRQCIDKGDFQGAFKYSKKAAELGDAEAHYNLSVMYNDGNGVEKDKKREVYHLEEAAIGGHPEARHNLGIEEWKNGRFERAAKHFIIAANLGVHESLKGVMKLHADGHASKEEYAGALRGYQAAVDEMNSTERDEAYAYFRAAGLL